MTITMAWAWPRWFAVVKPPHRGSAGLLVGMMFTAAYGNEGLLLQLATQLEQASPWWKRRAPVHAG